MHFADDLLSAISGFEQPTNAGVGVFAVGGDDGQSCIAVDSIHFHLLNLGHLIGLVSLYDTEAANQRMSMSSSLAMYIAALIVASIVLPSRSGDNVFSP